MSVIDNIIQLGYPQRRGIISIIWLNNIQINRNLIIEHRCDVTSGWIFFLNWHCLASLKPKMIDVCRSNEKWYLLTCLRLSPLLKNLSNVPWLMPFFFYLTISLTIPYLLETWMMVCKRQISTCSIGITFCRKRKQ